MAKRRRSRSGGRSGYGGGQGGQQGGQGGHGGRRRRYRRGGGGGGPVAAGAGAVGYGRRGYAAARARTRGFENGEPVPLEPAKAYSNFIQMAMDFCGVGKQLFTERTDPLFRLR